MAELSAFPWVLGPIPTDDEMWTEFERRLSLINQEMASKRDEQKLIEGGKTRRQYKGVHSQEIVEEVEESQTLQELMKEARELRDEPDSRVLLSDKIPLVTPDPYVALSQVIEQCSIFEHSVKPGKFKATLTQQETGLSFTAEIFKRKDDMLVVQLQRIQGDIFEFRGILQAIMEI